MLNISLRTNGPHRSFGKLNFTYPITPMLLELLDVSRDSVPSPETSRSNFSSAHRCCHPDTLTRESLLVHRRPPSTKIRQTNELRAAGTDQVPAYAFHS